MSTVTVNDSSPRVNQERHISDAPRQARSHPRSRPLEGIKGPRPHIKTYISNGYGVDIQMVPRLENWREYHRFILARVLPIRGVSERKYHETSTA